MMHYNAKNLWLILLLFLSSPAYSGAIILGLNVEAVESRFTEEGFDFGFGVQGGYEFKDFKSWHFGALFEFMNGVLDEDDLDTAGEMTYKSKSLFATARPGNWPIMFKVGVVDADYKILEEGITQNFREVSDTGYAYGVALSFGGDAFRLNLLDFTRVKIGNDSFDSYGISIAVFLGPAGFN